MSEAIPTNQPVDISPGECADIMQLARQHDSDASNRSCWSSLVHVRESWPSADAVGNLTVFNIGGNRYRLITCIDYRYRKIFIRAILTHAEYDREGWKRDPWY